MSEQILTFCIPLPSEYRARSLKTYLKGFFTQMTNVIYVFRSYGVDLQFNAYGTQSQLDTAREYVDKWYDSWWD